jgi:hypothetical protein
MENHGGHLETDKKKRKLFEDKRKEYNKKRKLDCENKIITSEEYDHKLSKIEENCEKKNGCWNWNLSKNENGYGKIGFFGKIKSVHQVSWECYNKKKPNKGDVIRHTCSNVSCANPQHLSKKIQVKVNFFRNRNSQ